MADNTSQDFDPDTPKFAAPKDKSCPYCGQAFTSSSLGRHLDLYIKERNPKPADGIHDVDAIRRMRGTITRRHPRGSIGGRRDFSTPGGTPRANSTKQETTGATDSDGYRTPSIPKDGQYAVDSTLSKFSFAPGWEATGVINDLPGKGSWDADGISQQPKRPGMSRSVSRQAAHKVQFDVKQKLADAMDTARAAELALRELLSSWRAAKQEISNDSMPFDFDPLSLDFPALTLQCLKPPPTLFSSTQHPTSTSWSVQSPGQREFVALQAFFKEEFRIWGITCAAATTTAVEEMTYPPRGGPLHDVREAVKKAEKSAENLEKQVNEHLTSAYAVWDSLPAQRRDEVWVLEMARSVGRKHQETTKLKEEKNRLTQEASNLKLQVDQLNRLQQPREFKIFPPSMIPFGRDVINHAYEQGTKSGASRSVGFDIEDRHTDLATVVTRCIERWKDVITSTRSSSGGLSAQKSLDQGAQPGSGNAATSGGSTSQAQTPQAARPPPKRQSTNTTNGSNGAISEHTGSTNTTAPPSVEEMSDQDADAEMEDDDSFAIMNTTHSPVKRQPQAPMQQAAALEVTRTRGPMQQRGPTVPDQHFLMPNGAGSPVGRAAINMSRSMPNINMALQSNNLHNTDISLAMQGVRGDGMYME